MDKYYYQNWATATWNVQYAAATGYFIYNEASLPLLHAEAACAICYSRYSYLFRKTVKVWVDLLLVQNFSCNSITNMQKDKKKHSTNDKIILCSTKT